MEIVVFSKQESMNEEVHNFYFKEKEIWRVQEASYLDFHFPTNGPWKNILHKFAKGRIAM